MWQEPAGSALFFVEIPGTMVSSNSEMGLRLSERRLKCLICTYLPFLPNLPTIYNILLSIGMERVFCIAQKKKKVGKII